MREREKETKRRDFTETPGRRSAFDEQYAHGHGSKSDLFSLHTEQDMPWDLSEGHEDAFVKAAFVA